MKCQTCEKQFKESDILLKWSDENGGQLHRTAYCFDCNVLYRQKVKIEDLK